MRFNLFTRAKPAPVTHEGAPAAPLTAEQTLRRSVLSCLLWEGEFYEDGQAIADRIVALTAEVAPEVVAALAVEARTRFHLRHAPLMLADALTRVPGGAVLVADTLDRVILRADELSEFVALYWRGGKRPLSKQVKRGLARAFARFDAYQLAKYDRDGPVRLRDVLFLVHPKPRDEAQGEVWTSLAEKRLAPPDTWEVALSGGADKRATFERLLSENRLGYLALLRNLRNMDEAGVDAAIVEAAILARRGADRVLPFRYVAAARAAPRFERALDEALSETILASPLLPGRTLILVDVSGSMASPLSGRSDLQRMDAAATLASVVSGELRVFTFADRVVEVPPRRGMAGVDVIKASQPHGSTYLGRAVAEVSRHPHDRLIVVTDEQSHDRVEDPTATPPGRAYMINVASARNGVGYGSWVHIDGFSEQVLRFIAEREAEQAGGTAGARVA